MEAADPNRREKCFPHVFSKLKEAIFIEGLLSLM
jgi:hypothetical protein